VRARTTIPIHFGTFVGSELESTEAIIELKEACLEHEVDAFEILDIGATKDIEVEEILSLG
jgi:hypothetical protein